MVAPLLVAIHEDFICDMLAISFIAESAACLEAIGRRRRPSVAHSVCCATQKEVSQAKAKKAAEAEEAQKKLADIMVEAQKKVCLGVRV